MIMEGEAAGKLLRRLAPHQDALERWLEVQIAGAAARKKPAVSHGAI